MPHIVENHDENPRFDPRQNNPYKKGGLKLLTKQKTNGIL